MNGNRFLCLDGILCVSFCLHDIEELQEQQNTFILFIVMSAVTPVVNQLQDWFNVTFWYTGKYDWKHLTQFELAWSTCCMATAWRWRVKSEFRKLDSHSALSFSLNKLSFLCYQALAVFRKCSIYVNRYTVHDHLTTQERWPVFKQDKIRQISALPLVT